MANPCNLGVWAKYEGIVIFRDGMSWHVYRRRWWAYLWPWYWRAVFTSWLVDSAKFTIKQQAKYAGAWTGVKTGFYLLKHAIMGLDKLMAFPVEKHMPDGLNTMYDAVDQNGWIVDPLTGMPVRGEKDG